MKKIIVGASIVVVLLFSVFIYLRLSENQDYKEKGKLLINKIEQYKSQHGKLPESIEDLNVESEMGEGPYYEKVDSLNYIVYFNIGFDNMLTYDSDTKLWVKAP